MYRTATPLAGAGACARTAAGTAPRSRAAVGSSSSTHWRRRERPDDLDDLPLLHRQAAARRAGVHVVSPTRPYALVRPRISRQSTNPRPAGCRGTRSPPRSGAARPWSAGRRSRSTRASRRCRRARGAGSPSNAPARIRLEDAGQDRDERRLARAVAADQAEALPGSRDRSTPRSAGAAEPLLDAGPSTSAPAADVAMRLEVAFWPADRPSRWRLPSRRGHALLTVTVQEARWTAAVTPPWALPYTLPHSGASLTAWW